MTFLQNESAGPLGPAPGSESQSRGDGGIEQHPDADGGAERDAVFWRCPPEVLNQLGAVADAFSRLDQGSATVEDVSHQCVIAVLEQQQRGMNGGPRDAAHA